MKHYCVDFFSTLFFLISSPKKTTREREREREKKRKEKNASNSVCARHSYMDRVCRPPDRRADRRMRRLRQTHCLACQQREQRSGRRGPRAAAGGAVHRRRPAQGHHPVLSQRLLLHAPLRRRLLQRPRRRPLRLVL